MSTTADRIQQLEVWAKRQLARDSSGTKAETSEAVARRMALEIYTALETFGPQNFDGIQKAVNTLQPLVGPEKS